ncbi:MAG: NAAT family transporter [Gammaproteobacteria bacterium]|nr:NAAT family transporter [Gammaproteobacteria bacterium]
MMELFLTTFTVFFVVVDPVGLAPIFAGLTPGMSDALRARAALKAVALSAAILLCFVVAGDPVLAYLGVELAAFRIAGGLLLLLLAIDMVFARQSGLRSTTESERHEAEYRGDISVFPLAFPLIAGPGALTTVLLVVAGRRDEPVTMAIVLAVIAIVLGMALAALLLARPITRMLGETGANVVSRLLGLALAALAVQYVIDGVRVAFLGAGGASPP